MDGFQWRWNLPSIGVVGLCVREDLRRQGVGKYFLSKVLSYIQEQFYEVVEMQVPEPNEPALKMCRSLGFEQVDVGRQYQKQQA
jgi:ribosomal protein S18 acetylase RimI-like enzyme